VDQRLRRGRGGGFKRTASMSNGGSTRLGARFGRASRGTARGTAEGGSPKTFLICRRPSGLATARMLADQPGFRDAQSYGQTYGQVEAPGVEATMPSPLPQILNMPAASLVYV
jgi:hypothetical protein